MTPFHLRRRAKSAVKRLLGLDEPAPERPATSAAPPPPRAEAATPPPAAGPAGEEEDPYLPHPGCDCAEGQAYAAAARAEAEAAAGEAAVGDGASVGDEAAAGAENAGGAEPAPAAEDAPGGEPAPVEEAGGAAAPEDDAAAEAEEAEPAAPSMEELQKVLDEFVRPALQMDGGDVELVKVEGRDVHVRLVGACGTCPSSIATLKMGVEALLKEQFPTIRNVVQVDAPEGLGGFGA